MHMVASCVWHLFLLHKIFVTLSDHYSHEHNRKGRQSSSEIPFSSEEFDSKISSSGSHEISEDLDYITPIERGYCKGHCGVADECAGSDSELNCINGGGKRRKRSLSDFDRKKDKENKEEIPLKSESEKNLSNYDVGYDYYDYGYESDDTRIVSGYNPVERPWMALILTKISWNSGNMCGGALLNNLFLVSAAHCFCKDPLLPCKRRRLRKRGKAVTHTVYDTKIVYLQLGINGDDITPFLDWSALAGHHKNKYKAEIILFHPNYLPYQKYPDISLVKANRRIKFEVGSISPICLPFKNFVDIPPRSDVELKAYAAGWGRDTSSNRESSEPVCDTDGLGPSPYSACSFPFRFDGQNFSKCAKTEPPPSFKHYVCNDFFQWAKHKNVDLWIGNHNNSYLIKYFDKYKKQFKRIQCYNPESRHGWCGTCYDYEGESIKSQEEGYCKKRKKIGLHIVNRLKYSRPAASRHWGWCSEKCHTIAKAYSNKLKETKVDVLTLQECTILGKQQQVNLNYEFCAGYKRLYPKTKVYRRIYDKRKRRFWYKLEKNTETNYLSWGKKGRKLDFFIGGTDACQGDSGGPVYVWSNSRAYLTGVVSRGKECALFNHPGIYTRITKFVPWIRKTIKAGKCGNSQKS